MSLDFGHYPEYDISTDIKFNKPEELSELRPILLGDAKIYVSLTEEYEMSLSYKQKNHAEKVMYNVFENKSDEIKDIIRTETLNHFQCEDKDQEVKVCFEIWHDEYLVTSVGITKFQYSHYKHGPWSDEHTPIPGAMPQPNIKHSSGGFFGRVPPPTFPGHTFGGYTRWSTDGGKTWSQPIEVMIPPTKEEKEELEKQSDPAAFYSQKVLEEQQKQTKLLRQIWEKVK